ncbi:HTH DNA binding protein [Arthrobacter phage Faja]|uniref:HTH DNA binding protein n=2 Tax=Caudoviricetes TaxID=2731619 RepID=A0A3G3M3G5_9CAUD|nr:HTH DNA binding protein [Arthrobacter phage Hestia]YP_010656365.1 HTH DNA binding protein [Arthrobacter phage Faja]AYN57929.1 HTH DNA binding protein [Arthrobacter phage Faja]AYR00946.1 HTH DNA binding protein [Arthrobacter phage Hestia]
MRGRPPRVKKEEFLRLHHEGLSAPQLAKHFDVSQRHVARLRRELGVARDTPEASHRVDAVWLAKAAQLLDDGAPVKEVAMTLGCTEATVNRHFPGRGWDHSTVGRHARAVRTASEELQLLHITPLYTNRRYPV